MLFAPQLISGNSCCAAEWKLIETAKGDLSLELWSPPALR